MDLDGVPSKRCHLNFRIFRMDTAMTTFSISPSELLPRMGTANAPVILDVRRDVAFEVAAFMLAGGKRSAPQHIAAWAAENAANRNQTVIVHCVYGHQVSQQACKELRALGFDAMYLAGGIQGGEDGVDSPEDIAAWRAVKLPLVAKPTYSSRTIG
jgi:rhodanese-related sulfurtransferase